jgi:WhiB family transcriptional regulator, redox-sensing transcriptional regulator
MPVRLDRPDWMARGACRGSDPELFFPVAAPGSAAEQVQAAKAVCGRCPVRGRCRAYALRTMPDGIWGGTTWEERAAVRARSIMSAALQAEPADDESRERRG